MISPKDLKAMEQYTAKNKSVKSPLAEAKPAPSVPRGNKNQQKPAGWK
jgi:hypothetical protein